MDPTTQSPHGSEIALLTERLRQFRDERNWGQFHHPKDLAVALSIEAGEMLERYVWKSPTEANPAKVREELADVFAHAFLLADRYGRNVTEIDTEKIARNAERYPIEKSKGSARKYTHLRRLEWRLARGCLPVCRRWASWTCCASTGSRSAGRGRSITEPATTPTRSRRSTLTRRCTISSPAPAIRPRP